MDPGIAAALPAAYALGCFTAGYYLVRLRTGRDIRVSGSGSAGATNVGRELGRAGFMITLALDAAKGAGAVAAAKALGAPPLAAAIAVVAGHIWPAQLGFRGGKGVAPALGALLAWDVRTVPLLAALFLPAFAALRSFEAAGLAAFALFPPLWLFVGDAPAALGLAVLVTLLLAAHRSNLRDEWRRRRRTPGTGR